MARVVVVGGGYGGLACAVRLAKTGHAVTLLESSDTLGGALGSVHRDGFTWDAGASSTLVPAVVRDLFRKSGRPLEREVDLVALDPIREHRFEDGSVLRLPGGSRSAQVAAFDALAPGLGERWAAHVASYTEDWEVLRRGYLEVPWRRDALPRDLAARLDGRRTLHRRLRRTFDDERARLVAAHPFVAGGHDPRDVPEWMGLVAYLEQRLGAWTVPGGLAAIGAALVARLTTRGVEVRTGTPATDVVVRGGRAVAVATPDGEVDADVVVCAIDPRRLPVLAPLVARTRPADPPTVCHLGLERAADLPDLAHETVLHGDPLVVLRTGGRAPDGGAAWTLHVRGRGAGDPVLAAARAGLDLRAHLVTRVDRTPADLVAQWGGSPLGVRWQGRSTVRRRLGPDTPVPGVLAAGAHATPGAGLPFVGLSAALVAQVVGPA